MAVAVFAAIALLFAACGGGEESQTAPTSGDPQSVVSAAPTQSVVTAAPAQSAVPAVTTEAAPAAPTQPTTTSASVNEQQETQAEATNPPQTTVSPQPTETLDSEPSGPVGGTVGDLAPEFSRISNWINSEPLTMEGLRGKVVLIDFLTYTCINCINTYPYLREWNAKYKDKGLVIIGVHTPEFEFEKVTENVVRNLAENRLTWPIAQDNDFGTWNAYSNRFWPAKYLIDASGVVRYTHFGEGGYIETEELIRDLLEESGASVDYVIIGTAEGPTADSMAYTTDQSTRLTRELYGGFQRNSSPQGIYVAQAEYYEGASQTLNYVDPGDHQNQFMYLQGPWTNGLENLKHARETQDYSDYIALKFFATTVNAVINPEGGPPFDVQVTIDGRPLTPEEAGPDLIVQNGRSFLRVDEPRMYFVVDLTDFGGHELKLSADSPDFALFAFTFGAYIKGS